MAEERPFTLSDLMCYDGERGNRKYVACAGVVYDVTDCPKWRPALHENLHFPAQDLTSELPDAPPACARNKTHAGGSVAPDGAPTPNWAAVPVAWQRD